MVVPLFLHNWDAPASGDEPSTLALPLQQLSTVQLQQQFKEVVLSRSRGI